MKNPPAHKNARKTALMVYLTVMALFFTLITIAVTTTMRMEQESTAFHAIEVKQPISFLDKTYLKHAPKTPTQ